MVQGDEPQFLVLSGNRVVPDTGGGPDIEVVQDVTGVVLGLNFTFAAKLPATLATIVLDAHAPENAFQRRAILEHNVNNVPNGNMARNSVHVILICSVFGPARHFVVHISDENHHAGIVRLWSPVFNGLRGNGSRRLLQMTLKRMHYANRIL